MTTNVNLMVALDEKSRGSPIIRLWQPRDIKFDDGPCSAVEIYHQISKMVMLLN